VVILHEIGWWIEPKKLIGLIFKIDFEKANDKVKCFFDILEEWKVSHKSDVLWSICFSTRGQCGHQNHDMGHHFQTSKWIRKGDPLSPVVFIIVADILDIMIERAKLDGQISMTMK
jgi:hypothetical protein